MLFALAIIVYFLRKRVNRYSCIASMVILYTIKYFCNIKKVRWNPMCTFGYMLTTKGISKKSTAESKTVTDNDNTKTSKKELSGKACQLDHISNSREYSADKKHRSSQNEKMIANTSQSELQNNNLLPVKEAKIETINVKNSIITNNNDELKTIRNEISSVQAQSDHKFEKVYIYDAEKAKYTVMCFCRQHDVCNKSFCAIC